MRTTVTRLLRGGDPAATSHEHDGFPLAKTGREFILEEETSMLANNVRSAIVASTIAAAALAPVRSAEAQVVSINGFNNFHVEEAPTTQPSNPYQCMFEDNGAVYNHCTGQKVTIDFNLPVSSDGEHTVYVRDYWNWTVNFNCIVYACPISFLPGGDHQCVVGGEATFTGPYQLKSVSVATGGTYPNMQNMALICWNLSPGDGIAMMTYNP